MVPELQSGQSCICVAVSIRRSAEKMTTLIELLLQYNLPISEEAIRISLDRAPKSVVEWLLRIYGPVSSPFQLLLSAVISGRKCATELVLQKVGLNILHCDDIQKLTSLSRFLFKMI